MQMARPWVRAKDKLVLSIVTTRAQRTEHINIHVTWMFESLRRIPIYIYAFVNAYLISETNAFVRRENCRGAAGSRAGRKPRPGGRTNECRFTKTIVYFPALSVMGVAIFCAGAQNARQSTAKRTRVLA